MDFDLSQLRPLLLAAANPGEQGTALRDAVARRPDWTRVVQMALDHGTAGLLCRRLLDAGSGTVPDDLVPAMQAYVDHCAVEHADAVAELLQVLDALAAAGVPAIPFKGPALAWQAYGDPALRFCRDLDILIPAHEVEATFAVLARLGFVSQYPRLSAAHREAYHRYNGHDCLTAPGRRRSVEPHWAIAPRTLGATLDTAGLFARAMTVPLGGRDIAALSIEDALLVAAVHGSKEEWSRLIWAADIAALLHRHSGLDAEAVLSRAAASGTKRMLLIGIALAVDLLHAPCSPAFLAALAADPASRHLAKQAAALLWQRRDAPSVFAFSTFRWRMRERLRDRLRYAAGTLLTARVKHLEAVNLPRSLHWLYPFVRLGHDYVALPLWRVARAKPRGALTG